MADNTKIEWTEATWNPITGCTVHSPGCTNCYAMQLAGTRLQHIPSRAGLTKPSKVGPVWTGEVRFNEEWLTQPLRWKRPRMIFVCAHGDLFHEAVPDEWIDRIFAVMALCPQHTFQVLTKRSDRMREYFCESTGWRARVAGLLNDLKPSSLWNGSVYQGWQSLHGRPDGLPNVWLGVSVEDQTRADQRIPDLLVTPAAVRWISAEPLLGPLGVQNARLDWIVVGGESGKSARPMHPDWARSLRDQCAAAGVPFFFKQWGEWAPGEIAGEVLNPSQAAKGVSWFNERWDECWSEVDGHCDDEPDLYRIGKKAAGRQLDGIEHNAMPVSA